jgi:hypothetical protein
MAKILNTGSATITNLSVTNSLSSPGGLVMGGNSISPGTTSPNSINFNYGDGSGWRANFGINGKPLASITDQGHVSGTQITLTDQNTSPKFNIYSGGNDYMHIGNASGSDSVTLGQGGDAYFTGGVFTPLINASNANINGNANISGAVNGAGLTVAGIVQLQNSGGGNNSTWFPYTDGNNYIRGPTVFDTHDVSIGKNLTVNNMTTNNMTASTANITKLNIGGIPITSSDGILTIGGIPQFIATTIPSTAVFIRICSQGNSPGSNNINANVWTAIIDSNGIMRIGWAPNDINTSTSGQTISSQLFYWIGNFLIHKKTGYFMQDDGRGNILLGPANANANIYWTRGGNYVNSITGGTLGQWTNDIVRYYPNNHDPQALIAESRPQTY